ncbi:hypothetical protein Pcinc_004574 [Petrolisthes cinctipes]|uniref:Uncharacterized protein n=1 Tax=Petrolisthes cinctipes TaxID=88211 RepID=A0AAE1GGL0_PETCI|nr:hypothetical protein Pcinc_004574 [Petrolisthes cinctipes]
MAGSNIHELYKILDCLTGDKRKHKLPESCSDSKLANDFVYFFDNKIKNIISTFVSDSSHMVMSEQTSDIKLSEFRIVSELTVSEMIKKAKPTYSAIDPMPFKLFNRNKRFRRECGKRAFANSAPRLYNNLPSFVRAAETAALFKKRLKTHRFTESYNLLNEEMRPSFRL